MHFIRPNVRQEDYLIPVLASNQSFYRSPVLGNDIRDAGSRMQMRINLETLDGVCLPLPSQHTPVELFSPV